MKKSLLALAVLGSFAGVAAAQTNVQIYGVADVGIAYDKGMTGAGSNWRVESGQQSGSRIGFRGTEDLGGGLAATFTLENGFNLDNGTIGQGGRLFGREATVGLKGGFGAVKLGRKPTEVYLSLLAVDPFAWGLAGASNRLFGYGLNNTDPILRTDNTINYTTNDYAGFAGSLSYAFGEQAGAFNRARSASAGLSYANGPAKVVFAYQNSRDVALGATLGAFGVGAAADVKVALIGGTYDFGVAKAHLAFQDAKVETAVTHAVTRKDRSYLVGVSAPVGVGTVMASWIRNDIRDIAAGTSNNYAIGYSHPLSKRTNLYTSIGYLKNDDNVRLNAFANGENVRLFNVGVRHLF